MYADGLAPMHRPHPREKMSVKGWMQVKGDIKGWGASMSTEDDGFEEQRFWFPEQPCEDFPRHAHGGRIRERGGGRARRPGLMARCSSSTSGLTSSAARPCGAIAPTSRRSWPSASGAFRPRCTRTKGPTASAPTWTGRRCVRRSTSRAPRAGASRSSTATRRARRASAACSRKWRPSCRPARGRGCSLACTCRARCAHRFRTATTWTSISPTASRRS